MHRSSPDACHFIWRVQFSPGIRWPGFFDAIQILSSLGLLSDQPILENGMTPAIFTHTILGKQGILKQDLHDISLIYVVIKLKNGGINKLRICAHYDPKTNLTGMSQLTCFTAAFTARTLLENSDTRPGIHMSHSWFTQQRINAFQKALLQAHSNSITIDEYLL